MASSVKTVSLNNLGDITFGNTNQFTDDGLDRLRNLMNFFWLRIPRLAICQQPSRPVTGFPLHDSKHRRDILEDAPWSAQQGIEEDEIRNWGPISQTVQLEERWHPV